MRWAKVPIAWAESEMVSDPIRVWLAISDRLRGLKRARIQPETIAKATKLPVARVLGGIEALTQINAISFDGKWLEVKPLTSRAPTCVELPPYKNKILDQGVVKDNRNTGGGNSTHTRVDNSTRTHVEDTFEERNRIAKIRTKAIKWINVYFEDPAWEKPSRKRRFWEKLQGLMQDELAPDVLRDEITEMLRGRAKREIKKRETKEQARATGRNGESRNHGNGTVDSGHVVGVSRSGSGATRST